MHPNHTSFYPNIISFYHDVLVYIFYFSFNHFEVFCPCIVTVYDFVFSSRDVTSLLEAPNFLFFKFLSLANPKDCAMNLAELWTMPSEPRRTSGYHALLRKCQHAGFESFYERLKQTNAVEWAKTHIDPKLKDSDFGDEMKKWFLAFPVFLS